MFEVVEVELGAREACGRVMAQMRFVDVAQFEPFQEEIVSQDAGNRERCLYGRPGLKQELTSRLSRM